MKSNFRENKDRSDHFLPIIIDIFKKYFKVDACIPLREDDLKKATDLIVYSKPPVRIAVRVRKFKRPEWCEEFTIRCKAQGTGKTEYAKILEGYGDLLILAFHHDEKIVSWKLINLNVFRKEYLTGKPVLRYNGDGTAFFSYKIKNFSPKLVVRQYASSSIGNNHLS